MTASILVQVPSADSDNLDELATKLGATSGVTLVHPFDGETMAQILVTVSTGSFPFFALWVRERIAARNRFQVVVDGTELTGYTADEANTILERLRPKDDEPGDGSAV
jgi:hypothetical protein